MEGSCAKNKKDNKNLIISLRIIIFMILIFPLKGYGTIYYVDGKNGKDSWDGMSSDYQGKTKGPFKTISKALDRYAAERLVGGNTIKIKTGIYRERIVIANIVGNLDEKTRFFVEAYGDGEVIIDASDTHLLNWSPYVKNNKIYVSICNFSIDGNCVSPHAVIMDDNFKGCHPVYSLSDVDIFGKWYYDASTKKLYLHTNGDTPLSHDVIVTKFDQNNSEYGIYSVDDDYITISGLTIRGAGALGIYAPKDHINIENCIVKFSGKQAILTNQYSNILKNHIYGCALRNWPRGSTWGSTGGWPSTVATRSNGNIQGNSIHDNGGEGIIPGSYSIVEGNTVYNNWSVNIYSLNVHDVTIRKNLVYCTEINLDDVISRDHMPTGSSLVGLQRRLRPEGIMTGDEGILNLASAYNYQIYNNIIINCRRGYTHYAQSLGSGLKNYLIANNTIIIPDEAGLGEEYVGVLIDGHNGNNTNTYFINNIIYGRHRTSRLFKGGASNKYGVISDNNLWFHADNQNPFWWMDKEYDFKGFQLVSRQDKDSIFANPGFRSIPKDVIKGNYHLLPESPVVRNGRPRITDIVKDDFDGLLRNPLEPSIGAYEGTCGSE
ncbi:MAG: right-handed parallel beta-helix repeat-containing protein [bacterium]